MNKFIIFVFFIFSSFGILAEETDSLVKSIISKQLNLQNVSVEGSLSLKSLGADALDVMEVVMQLEKSFGIKINDDDLIENSSNIDVTEYPRIVTVEKLIQVVKNSPKIIHKESAKKTISTNIIQDGEVGAFGTSSKKNNPNKFQFVFIPSFEDVLEYKKSELKRPLTEQEISLIKSESVVIALPNKVATQFLRKRGKE